MTETSESTQAAVVDTSTGKPPAPAAKKSAKKKPAKKTTSSSKSGSATTVKELDQKVNNILQQLEMLEDTVEVNELRQRAAMVGRTVSEAERRMRAKRIRNRMKADAMQNGKNLFLITNMRLVDKDNPRVIASQEFWSDQSVPGPKVIEEFRTLTKSSWNQGDGADPLKAELIRLNARPEDYEKAYTAGEGTV